MNHVQVVLHLQIPTLTKLFASGKPIKIIQICKMLGKQNIISYILENNFINFFVVSKSMNYPQKRLGLHIQISSSNQHPCKN